MRTISVERICILILILLAVHYPLLACSAKEHVSTTAHSSKFNSSKKIQTARTPTNIVTLKSLTPRLDTPQQKVLIGRIKELGESPSIVDFRAHDRHIESGTYPISFDGVWSGPFTVQEIAGGTKSNGSILYAGRRGVGNVGFSADSRGTRLVSMPIVFFDLTDEDKRSMRVPLTQPARVHVGFGEAHDAVLGGGAIKNSRIVSNTVRGVSQSGTVEQRIIEESWIFLPTTHETFSAGRAAVFQFSPVQPNQLDVYLAATEFKKDGTLMSKMLLHGRLKRN